jgi:7-cyano-7-deazaguanine synthase
MCSINGVIKLKGTLNQGEWLKFSEICKKGSFRGRDSFGVEAFYDRGFSAFSERRIGNNRVMSVMNLEKFKEGIKVAISNNRAEPTTEYVLNKKESDVQPYSFSGYHKYCNRYWVVHNGTIANDKQLIKKYNFSTPSKIDSAVIAPLLDKKWTSKGSLRQLANILSREVLGSYAFAIYDRFTPEALYLAVNYKPLFLEKVGDTIYFTSLKEFFGKESNQLLASNIVQIPPYSAVKISDSGIEVINLRKPKKKKTALVVCSGGLDSTVSAQVMKNKGYKVTLLHFQYNCRAESREVQAVKEIAEAMKVPYWFITTDIFSKVIKHSPILDKKKPAVAKMDKGVELAYEWVPARNLIMLSIATGIAEAYGFDKIVLGNNLEESGAYPDNEAIFIEKFAEILPYAVNLNKEIQIEMPVGNLMKHEIIKLGIREKAPLDKTWSCYDNGILHCGVCGPCRMRKVGFQMNNIKDSINYLK